MLTTQLIASKGKPSELGELAQTTRDLAYTIATLEDAARHAKRIITIMMKSVLKTSNCRKKQKKK